MPGGDRTGPQGWGPTSGRGAGYCGGYDAPGFANPMPGRGYGWGGRRRGRGGGGRGWRHQFYATGLPGWARQGYGPGWGYAPPPTEEEEMAWLKREAEWLQNRLDVISQRIDELE